MKLGTYMYTHIYIYIYIYYVCLCINVCVCTGQCQMLDMKSIHIDQAIEIKLEESIAIEKILGRRYCDTCRG